MKIRLNGEPHELARPLTVATLLDALGIDARRVAVEHNLTVVKRGDYQKTMVEEGDEVEIVNFVGGGAPVRSSEARPWLSVAKQRAERERGVALRLAQGQPERSRRLAGRGGGAPRQTKK